MFICYNRDSVIVIIVVLINRARAFYNCVAMCYCYYCEVRLLLLIIMILLLLSSENRVNKFKVLFSFWFFNNNNININIIIIINKCYIFLYVYYLVYIFYYRNNVLTSCVLSHNEMYILIKIIIKRDYNHLISLISFFNKHFEKHLNLFNWLWELMKFVKSMLTMLIINLIISRRRRGPLNRFFYKLKINNVRTFDL